MYLCHYRIESDRAAELFKRGICETGESKTAVVTRALELYLKSLSANKRADAAIAFVRDKIHPLIEPSQLGRVPSKEEQEEMLGM